MTPAALIVEWQTPDLLELCLASLRRFAPNVVVHVETGGPGPEWHGLAINRARREGVIAPDLDPVILLDTDTVILSEDWWTVLETELRVGADVVGGHRSRGEACQMFLGPRPLLHASMLAMRRWVFDRVESFMAQPLDPALGHVIRDTAWQVSQIATAPRALPYWPVTHGPVFPGLQVGEYCDWLYPDGGPTLWSHLWRGTGMPAGGRLRQAVRALRVKMGSPYALTVQRAQQRKAAWMARAWEVVRG